MTLAIGTEKVSKNSKKDYRKETIVFFCGYSRCGQHDSAKSVPTTVTATPEHTIFLPLSTLFKGFIKIQKRF